MNVTIIAATCLLDRPIDENLATRQRLHPENITAKLWGTTQDPFETAKDLSGKAAGICYMKDGHWNDIAGEPVEKTMTRLQGCIKSGHHSVMDHAHFTLLIEHVPKILAMILNNEKAYTTSEKSARYTVMISNGREHELYEKWVSIFAKEILRQYPNIDDGLKPNVLRSQKLAQENARYFISVFTPATTLAYTASYRQIGYMLHWIEKFDGRTAFLAKVRRVLVEFADHLKTLGFEPLDDGKGRGFSLFSGVSHKDEFGENYSVSYDSSFAMLAQAQRHRTISYECSPAAGSGYLSFYIPPIIRHDDTLMQTWLDDMDEIRDNFPQGGLVRINERSTLENFLLKCQERMCGAAQLEIMHRTVMTAQAYYDGIKRRHHDILESDRGKLLELYATEPDGLPRCAVNYQCTRPCYWTGARAMTRKI